MSSISGQSNPQLDLWYDLETVTSNSATYSTVDSYRGDFHLEIHPSRKSQGRKLVLLPGAPGMAWKNAADLVLEGQIKTELETVLRVVRIFDAKGKSVEFKMKQDVTNAEWTPLSIPLYPNNNAKQKLPGSVSRLEFIFNPGPGSIAFDNLKLRYGEGASLYVTDKPLNQRLAETAGTRESRMNVAFAEAAREPRHDSLMNEYFARLWVAQTDNELKSVNDDLHRLLTSKDSEEWNQRRLNGHWNLSVTHFLLRCYNTFSARTDGDKQGRLEKRTEDALLAVLWDRTIHENDIYITRNSTLAMDGSENHDLDSKVASLLASKIFMEHSDWADKVLPNIGKGSGSGYWFHQDGNTHVYGPEGLAEWRAGDTKDYVSRDHYEAWVEYFHRFIVDRAKSGFFLEKASGHYMTYTMGYLFDMHTWCGDEALKEATADLLDVIWAEWAIDQLHGLRGGAKTRYKYQPNPTPEGIRDAFSGIGQFFFGGAGNAQHNYFSTMLSDYEMPEMVWKLAFDRKSLGSYAYASRQIGESPANYIGEPGLERTIVCNPTSSLIRYSWVTPDYILGTQMDHPGATHNHLSVSGRFQGLFFAEPRGAAAYVKGIIDEKEFSTPAMRYPYNNTMVRSVQDKQVAVFQAARRVLRQSPAWFPNETHHPDGMMVGFAKAQHVEEENGWIFVQNGEGLLAVRVVDGVQKPMSGGGNAANKGVIDYPLQSEHVDLVETPYTWNESMDKILFDDLWSPVIFEAGRLDDFGSLPAFKEYIFGNKVTLLKTVVPGFYRLRYEYGENNENRIDFNAGNLQIPRINGAPLDYAPAYLFNSPFLQSEYQSGVIYFGLPQSPESVVTKRFLPENRE
ncbi:MAG: hypothetical protein AB3N64_13390 [Puniceicoccaceae bacterium]